MKSTLRLVASMVLPLAFAACATTEVTQREVLVDEKVPRPDRIMVYDFVATPADLPTDSDLAAQVPKDGPAQTAEQIAAGRALGSELAYDLANELVAMGLPAEHAVKSETPRLGDIVIRGYLLSIDEGSATKRVAIGFGQGNAELKTAVEGFQMTRQGLRKLGDGTVDTAGGKTPGMAAPAAIAIATANPVGLIASTGVKGYGEYSGSSKVTGKAKETAKLIAEQLRPRFQKQGWIP